MEFVVLTRQVPTSAEMPQFEMLQLSNFLWIMVPKGIAGGMSKLATF
jgi:hypothetical protein